MQPGDTIADRFVIERAVAAGGMGRIYRARDRHSDSSVAIKLLTQESESARSRFLQESTVLAEIQHPGVVRYVAHGRTSAGAAYLAMEWLEGEDLAGYLRRQRRPSPGSDERPGGAEDSFSDPIFDGLDSLPAGTPADAASSDDEPYAWYETEVSRPARTPLPIATAVVLGRRLASAVAELHRRGVVHRDLKPSNVFLPGSVVEQLKVVDLGTVWRERPGGLRASEEVLVGTPHYMAPEQAHIDGEITPATDVWAIGCVLYFCLTGCRPFTGDDPIAILARIIVEDPTPVEVLRPDVPPALAAVIAQAMHKEPNERPADAAELARMFERIGEVSGIIARPDAPSTGRRATTQSRLTSSERRVTCLALADVDGPAGISDEDRAALARVVAPSGCQLSQLADGTLLMTVPGNHPPTDQATRAARAALAARDLSPGLRLVLATGRTDGPHVVGAAVSAAARALRAATRGRVHLDELTASLLDTRFHLARDRDGAASLGRERVRESTRTLLGKRTPWVGRDQELARLLGAFDDCVRERAARAVLVTGGAGMGKSRLRFEFEDALRTQQRPLLVVACQGDLAGAGSPFLLIAPALRRVAGILDGEPVAVARDKLRACVAKTTPAAQRERVTLFLGELAGVPFDSDNDALIAARKDLMLMGQLMQSAWEEWLGGECRERPVLIIIEDLHWGDPPSLRLIDAALSAHRDQPLMVLALARPEVDAAFPQLWEKHPLERYDLAGLSAEAAADLIRSVLGDEVPDGLLDALVRRADGNAFFLEELIRSAAESGARTLPETVLGMVQARLDALGPEARRILRAASVFGEVFWHGGVAALSGEGGAFPVHEWLDELVQREVVVRQAESRMPGEVEYRFRHALVRDAAYAMLTADDLSLGHGLAGAWLLDAGERDGRVLAEHFLRSEDPSRARPHLLRAAEQAMEGNDFDAVLQLAERGAGAGASGETLGQLRALQAAAAFWLGDLKACIPHGVEAANLLPAGSKLWFVAVGTVLVSSCRLGDFDIVDELSEAALSAPCEPEAESSQLICLCRFCFQLLFNGYYERADRVIDRITVLATASERLDALTQAQVHHLQSIRGAIAGDIERTLRRLTAAVGDFERAGDIRNVALERTSLAWWWAELGYSAHARKMCEDNLRFCERQQAQQAITFAKVNLGFILCRCDAFEAARAILAEAEAECREVGNVRLEGWTLVNCAEVAHASGDHPGAADAAARAIARLESSPSLRAWALAVHARALLALGGADEARKQAEQAVAIAAKVRLIHGVSLPYLTLAKAHHACGDITAARQAIAIAAKRLEARAALLVREGWRERFLGKPEHREITKLAADWLP